MENFVENRVVNPWIVCRSKSYQRRIYYFNTLTGEAVWNLSDLEIEKAKKAAKINENLGEYPEPKDPPQDIPNHNYQLNKFIDNIPNIGSTNICNNKTTWDKPNEIALRNHCCLNPKCNIPAQQFPNSMAPIMNNTQYQMDMHLNKFSDNGLKYVQSTAIPLNMRFEILKNKMHNNSYFETNLKDTLKIGENTNPPGNVQCLRNDLRDFLSRKRQIKFTKVTDEPKQLFTGLKLINDKILVVNKATDAETTNCHHSNMANDNHIIKDPEKDLTLIKKNALSHLKNMAKCIVQKDLWYIMPDVNTFLYHLEFLKSIVETDEECRLMVLESVKTDIQNISRSDDVDEINRARCALSYISQRNRTGIAIIAKDSAAVTNKSKSYILDCCWKLRKANYHFILLCNDKELHNHEKASGIPMFTVDEMKSFFGAGFKEDTMNRFQNNQVMKKMAIPNNEIRLDDIEPNKFLDENIYRSPKISTVNAETQTNEDMRPKKVTIDIGVQANLDQRLTLEISTQTIQSSLQASRLDKVTKSILTIDSPVKTNTLEGSTKTMQSTLQASTLDRLTKSIQTIESPVKTNTLEISTKTSQSSLQASTLDKLTKSIQLIYSPVKTNTLEKAVHNSETIGLVKRREIQLNRSLPSQSSKKEDTEKKNFKWRRKRPVIHLEKNDTTQINEKPATDNLPQDLDRENISKIDSTQKQLKVYNKEMQQVPVSNEINFGENDVLEEASIAALGSKAQTKLDSKNGSIDNVHEQQRTHETTKDGNSDENKSDNCFMFEVTNQVMEEYLKTRSDEWVSRFSQIMEEVLTQLWQKDPLTSSVSPPWSVHEATQCIKMKYYENKDIVDAADNLSRILLRCSDSKGKIDINMSPDQFMKMYSYAVYLIDSLQVIIKNSEDLLIASKSMGKLLNDIQNPNMDTSQNDSFTDMAIETALDASITDTSNTDMERSKPGSSHEISTCSTKRERRIVNNLESSPKYNLRSQWKRIIQNNKEDSSSSLTDQFAQDNPESYFFACLDLRKNAASEENNTSEPDNEPAAINLTASNSKRNEAQNNEPLVVIPTSEIKPPENEAKNNESAVGTRTVEVNPPKNAKNNEPTVVIPTSEVKPPENAAKEPKIIRNFTLCAEFEAKLKNKESELTLNYANAVNAQKENYPEDDLSDEDIVDHEQYCINETDYDCDVESLEGEPVEQSPIKNDKFKYVISELVREIRESFLMVYDFCEDSRTKLKGPDASEDAKNILKTAEETHLIITRLFTGLNRIHNRDVTEMERLFAKFLDSAELNDLKFEENDFQKYRGLIGKCIDRANLLRESVKCIMRYAAMATRNG